MTRTLKKKINCVHCHYKGKILFYIFTGKDKKHLTGTEKGRGVMLSGCDKCGYSGDSYHIEKMKSKGGLT